jgi:TRAP-type C4-dicarboxylate transport system substrate-binding protein
MTLLKTRLALKVAATSFAAFSIACPALAEEPVELSFSMMLAQSHPHSSDYIVPITKMIEERTEGRVTVEIKWGDALGAAKDQYFVVRDGLADMGYFVTGYTPGRFPTIEVASLPYAASSTVNVNKAVAAVAEAGLMGSEYDEVIPLHYLASSPYSFSCPNLTIDSVDDFAGVKMRSPGSVQNKVLEALGATPVVVPYSEAYSALQSGLVDCWINGPATILSSKLYEVSENFLLSGFSYYGGSVIAMNEQVKDKVSAEDYQTILDVFAETKFLGAEATDLGEAAALEELKTLGVAVTTLSAEETAKFQALVEPIWGEWIADMESKGLPGEEIATVFANSLRELGDNPSYGN